MCGISTYKEVKFIGKILQHCCGNSFSFLKWSGKEAREFKGGKEWSTELNHRQKVRFSTLLLPVLVTWKTLDTRGRTASHHHTEILNSCNSYPWTLFDTEIWQQ